MKIETFNSLGLFLTGSAAATVGAVALFSAGVVLTTLGYFIMISLFLGGTLLVATNGLDIIGKIGDSFKARAEAKKLAAETK